MKHVLLIALSFGLAACSDFKPQAFKGVEGGLTIRPAITTAPLRIYSVTDISTIEPGESIPVVMEVKSGTYYHFPTKMVHATVRAKDIDGVSIIKGTLSASTENLAYITPYTGTIKLTSNFNPDIHCDRDLELTWETYVVGETDVRGSMLHVNCPNQIPTPTPTPTPTPVPTPNPEPNPIYPTTDPFPPYACTRENQIWANSWTQVRERSCPESQEGLIRDEWTLRQSYRCINRTPLLYGPPSQDFTRELSNTCAIPTPEPTPVPQPEPTPIIYNLTLYVTDARTRNPIADARVALLDANGREEFSGVSGPDSIILFSFVGDERVLDRALDFAGDATHLARRVYLRDLEEGVDGRNQRIRILRLEPIVQAIPPPRAEGYLDFANENVITGWARALDSNQAVEVQLFVDGILRSTQRAEHFRADIGSHGYSFVVGQLLPPLAPGAHTISVSVGSTVLTHAPASIVIPNSLNCGVAFTGTHDTVGLSNGDPRFICFNNRWYDCGWELNDHNWETKVPDGQRIGSFTCNLNQRRWAR